MFNASLPWNEAAPLFAALGDPTRLQLLARIGSGEMAITQLSDGAAVSRQAITKHLDVLQQAGLVEDRRQGRERLWKVRPDRIQQAHHYLDDIARQWDDALLRLKTFVEEG